MAPALLVSIALTTGINVPHGEWASITVLVVIGGLQHHGNIRRRAAERGVGTLIGAFVGLFLILQESYFRIRAADLPADRRGVRVCGLPCGRQGGIYRAAGWHYGGHHGWPR